MQKDLPIRSRLRILATKHISDGPYPVTAAGAVTVHRFKDIFSPVSSIVLEQDMTVRTVNGGTLGTLEHLDMLKPSHTWIVVSEEHIEMVITLRNDMPRHVPVIREKMLDMPAQWHDLQFLDMLIPEGHFCGHTLYDLSAVGVSGERILIAPDNTIAYIVRT